MSSTRSQIHLAFVVNTDWFFLSHRLAIARAARAAGYEVHIACGLTGRRAEMEAEGFTVHPIRLQRGSIAGLTELTAMRDMAAVIRAVRPDIVHLVTIKPVLFGGAVARLLGVPRVVAAISGLGYMFIDDSVAGRARRALLSRLYRFALGHERVRVIFQNRDDRDLIGGLAGLRPSQIRMIRDGADPMEGAEAHLEMLFDRLLRP